MNQCNPHSARSHPTPSASPAPKALKTRYVVGFLFSPDGSEVVLIEKQKPAWQQGLLNGVGGKIEDGETPLQAMCREFREEASLRITSWQQFASLEGDTWIVYFFAARSIHYYMVADQTEECTKFVEMTDLGNRQCVPNLAWLVPLARHVLFDAVPAQTVTAQFGTSELSYA